MGWTLHMIMCVLLCYPVSIRVYYQQGVLFLVLYQLATFILTLFIVLQPQIIKNLLGVIQILNKNVYTDFLWIVIDNMCLNYYLRQGGIIFMTVCLFSAPQPLRG